MPDNSNQPARVIKGALPRSNYAASTTRLVQGQASNKTAQYLAGIQAHDPGQQGFYGEALNDIPHPLDAGRQINYHELQQVLNGPQRAQALDAYASANRLGKVSAEQMQQSLFDAARARLDARGAANPGVLAFPAAADSARRAPNTATAIAHGNFAPADEASNAAVQAQRFADIAGTTPVMAAPGMAVKLVRGAAPVAPAARVIRSNIASR